MATMEADLRAVDRLFATKLETNKERTDDKIESDLRNIDSLLTTKLRSSERSYDDRYEFMLRLISDLDEKAMGHIGLVVSRIEELER